MILSMELLMTLCDYVQRGEMDTKLPDKLRNMSQQHRRNILKICSAAWSASTPTAQHGIAAESSPGRTHTEAALRAVDSVEDACLASPGSDTTAARRAAVSNPDACAGGSAKNSEDSEIVSCSDAELRSSGRARQSSTADTSERFAKMRWSEATDAYEVVFE